MSDGTKIEWTDATWNPITGCFMVSPGCTNCYAMKLAGTRLQHHPSRAGLTRRSKGGSVWTGEVRFNEQWLTQPLTWTKPRMIFVCAHGDLFADGVPDEWIDQVFAVMALAPQHTFQVLTKRPERMQEYLYGDSARQRVAWCEAARVMNQHAAQWRYEGIHGKHRSRVIEAGMSWPLPNVWLGVSVEDQKRADERRDPMASLAADGWTTWVSYEPALGPVEWRGWEFLKWLVSGGESGADARPSHPDWHRAARDYSAANDIAFLFKQWGAWREPIDGEIYNTGLGRTASPPAFIVSHTGTVHCFENPTIVDGKTMIMAGKKSAGRLLDGIEHNAFPVTGR